VKSQGRFPVIEASQMALPAKCYSCGSNTPERKYIDLHIDVEYYGVIYFCTDCFRNTANDVGYVSSEEFDILGKELSRVFASEDRTEKRYLAIRNALVYVLLDTGDSSKLTDEFIGRLVSAFEEAGKRIEANNKSSANGEGSSSSRSRKGSKQLRNDATDSESGDDAESPEKSIEELLAGTGI
jgi:hypothetical protein